MVKIIIDGGDNGYCCNCGGLCDRHILEEDTSAKTLKYIDDKCICLGKHCMFAHACDDGTIVRHGLDGKMHAYRGEEELPCVVRNNKWGKDCEFGTRGTTFGASVEDYESGRVALRDYTTGKPTGWVLIVK